MIASSWRKCGCKGLINRRLVITEWLLPYVSLLRFRGDDERFRRRGCALYFTRATKSALIKATKSAFLAWMSGLRAWRSDDERFRGVDERSEGDEE